MIKYFFLKNLFSSYKNSRFMYPKVFGYYKSSYNENFIEEIISLMKKSGFPVCSFKSWGSQDMALSALSALDKFKFNLKQTKKIIKDMGFKRLKEVAKKNNYYGNLNDSDSL